MTFRAIFKINRYLFAANLMVLVMFGVFFVSGLSHTDIIDTKQIVLRGSDGIPNLRMVAENKGAVIALLDKSGVPRLQLQGGEFPSIILRAENGQVIGSFSSLDDGGSAIGLGDHSGQISTFLRSGETPPLNAQ